MWTKKQIEQHKRAAFLLNKIKDEAFSYISERGARSVAAKRPYGVTEWQVHEFILGQYKKHGLVTAENRTIVAFGRNTRHIHHYPLQDVPRHLKRRDLIMLDIWARLHERGAPYADITWMGYYRGTSKLQFPSNKEKNRYKGIQKIFDIVTESRDACLKFIQAHVQWGILPTGKEADSIARYVIMKAGFEKTFRHSTGHGLGLVSPHWRGRNLSQRNKYALVPHIGYTIEPGIYLEENLTTGRAGFGCRSEMNFYIDERTRVIVTTPMQGKIVIL